MTSSPYVLYKKWSLLRVISIRRCTPPGFKLAKLFGIDDFSAAKDFGKVFIIIIYCFYNYYYYIFWAPVALFLLFVLLFSQREANHSCETLRELLPYPANHMLLKCIWNQYFLVLFDTRFIGLVPHQLGSHFPQRTL